MEFSWFDYSAFVIFIGAVIVISLYASRKQDTSEDYFLAGRGLSLWLIGFSLIASNISTEHFVGMAGEGFGMGLAIASYEWIAAITLVFVALFLLPKFLKSGIYTIPEFLEYRFNATARAIMAFYMMVAYVVVAIAAVLYSGALALNTIFNISLVKGIWLIGILAGVYTIYGGLKAVVWSDLLQGAALLIGGAIVTVLGFKAVGGVGVFIEHSADKLHTILPADHPTMPWTIMLAGIWIPNIFYWGLNQFITQRTLGAKSLAEGQRGIILAAWIKLLIPFIIVFPGIMAFQLFGSEVPQADQAYPFMIKKILPAGLRGIMFAALFGAVMSSLDSMLNSAATIFTIDLYKRHFRPDSEARRLVLTGRIMTGVFVIIGCLWAPYLAKFKGVFEYIQMVWGFVSPGIVAVFLFGLVIKKAPPLSAVGALILTVPVYGLCLWLMPGAFLNAMAVTVLVLWVYMAVVTFIRPLAKPVEFPVRTNINLAASPGAKVWGAITVAATVALYIIFR
jgi:SSS family solute:Na+ symporter